MFSDGFVVEMCFLWFLLIFLAYKVVYVLRLSVCTVLECALSVLTLLKVARLFASVCAMHYKT